jgi:hypothetical protein
MTWVKVDDRFPQHEKVLAAGPEAGWLYICGLCYAARTLSNGVLPRSELQTFSPYPEAQSRDLAVALVDQGLWETTRQQAWVIHDYLRYNPSRADVEAKRARWRAKADSKRGTAKSVSGETTSPGRHPNPTGVGAPVSGETTSPRDNPPPSIRRILGGEGRSPSHNLSNQDGEGEGVWGRGVSGRQPDVDPAGIPQAEQEENIGPSRD